MVMLGDATVRTDDRREGCALASATDQAPEACTSSGPAEGEAALGEVFDEVWRERSARVSLAARGLWATAVGWLAARPGAYMIAVDLASSWAPDGESDA